nr:MAG TPA: hypothetical protein [Caudoviricetes sp.]
MITDEQGREWLLQKLYDEGWRYIVADNFENIFLTGEKPSMYDDVDELRIGSCKKCMGAYSIAKILPKLKANEVFNIAEELGIVDWSKVKVDTPILVSNDNKEWIKRYFARYEDGNVYGWLNGKTSWTAICELSIGHWNYAKLAEV